MPDLTPRQLRASLEERWLRLLEAIKRGNADFAYVLATTQAHVGFMLLKILHKQEGE